MQPISVRLYTPHKNQARIHEAIANEPYKYYVLNIGRQFGKSLLAINQCLKWALNGKCEIGWVSPIYNQADKVYEQVVKAFAASPGIIIKKDATKLKIEFCTGSTLQFFSAERYDNIRGFTFDYLVCDEFAFIEEKAWTEVLRATVLVKGKKVLLISTPKGRNHFYLTYSLAGINPQYKSFTMTSYDGIASKQEIDAARETLPDNVFRQEYLAEFIEGGALFSGLQVVQGEAIASYSAGLDVGRADDYTVLTIYNSKGQMYYCQRWRHASWGSIVKEVAAKIVELKAKTMIEVNGVGDPVYEMLLKEVNGKTQVEPWVTSSKSKQEIIEQIIVATQNKEFTIVPTEGEWLKREFEVFTYEYSPKSRSIKYSAPQGFHDDGVMASAIGYQAFKFFNKRGTYMIA